MNQLNVSLGISRMTEWQDIAYCALNKINVPEAFYLFVLKYHMIICKHLLFIWMMFYIFKRQLAFMCY